MRWQFINWHKKLRQFIMKTIKLLSTYLILLTTLMTCTTVPRTVPPPTTSTPPSQTTTVEKPTKVSPVVVPTPYVHYSATGSATWYQLADHGLETGSGEVYDLYGKTAAHASLPFGSQVRITNLANDESATVIINDRIQGGGGSLIRLSYIVAKQLKLLGRSNPQVSVTTLPPLK